MHDSHNQRETLKRIHSSRKTVTLFMKMSATKANLIRLYIKKSHGSLDSDIVLHLESLEDRARAISKGIELVSLIPRI